jgi:hypothetical protein
MIKRMLLAIAIIIGVANVANATLFVPAAFRGVKDGITYVYEMPTTFDPDPDIIYTYNAMGSMSGYADIYDENMVYLYRTPILYRPSTGDVLLMEEYQFHNTVGQHIYWCANGTGFSYQGFSPIVTRGPQGLMWDY